MSEWSSLWLNYRTAAMPEGGVPERIRLNGFSRENPVTANAVDEWKRGLSGMFGISAGESEESGQALMISRAGDIPAEGYRITPVRRDTGEKISGTAGGLGILLEASDESGALYGVFRLLQLYAAGKTLPEEGISAEPSDPLRMLNHWDNMDGSIERGYSGRSFFFKDGEIIIDDRTRDYARIVSSVGINGVVINNVNVKNGANRLITPECFADLAELSALFSGYGIKLFLSLNFASPIEVGGMDTCDPADPGVIAWWKERMAMVFGAVPGLGGFLVKADSEGRPGPFTYGRTQAEGANMLAAAVKPYGGIIIWRCFVYNCTQDWRDRKTDRARAGYDNFAPMDGTFAENVILQIKNGPMDFQIREPVSPLFGGLTRTNQILEVQIAQEYTGQQIDLCYLIPLFKEVLEFRTFCPEGAAEDRAGEDGSGGSAADTEGKPGDTVADIVCGRRCGNRPRAGSAAVSNTGDDACWTGNDLAAANLFGFGRLAYDNSLSAEEIAGEWTALTFGLSGDEADLLTDMLMRSREVYEHYTSPLGIGWMVNPGVHYGPSVDGYEYSRWGTYHRADHLGIGVDRTDKGTGYAMQYREPNASMYNDPDTCPEELLLFFHRIRYDRRLKDGRTLIQYIYDTHFQGLEEAHKLAADWEALSGAVDPGVHARVAERFRRQEENAREWCDQVNSYFFRKSGIPDERGRTIY